MPTMYTLHESTVIDAMGFTPLDLVDVHVGRLTAKLYLKIGPVMKIWEEVLCLSDRQDLSH
jgi:hypothetical protein